MLVSIILGIRHLQVDRTSLLDFKIDDKCPFCSSSFFRLDKFIAHLDTCEMRPNDESDEKQIYIGKRKERLTQESNEELNESLDTKDGENPLQGVIRSCNDGSVRGVSRKRTPGSLALRSRDGREDSVSGSSIINSRAFGRKAHFQTGTSPGERLLQTEERQLVPKRRRTGTNVSPGTLFIAKSNQSHQMNEGGDIGGAMNAVGVTRCIGSRVVEKPSSNEGPRNSQGQVSGTTHRVVTPRAMARAYWLPGLLTGRVYELIYLELQALATSDEIHGQI